MSVGKYIKIRLSFFLFKCQRLRDWHSVFQKKKKKFCIQSGLIKAYLILVTSLYPFSFNHLLLNSFSFQFLTRIITSSSCKKNFFLGQCLLFIFCFFIIQPPPPLPLNILSFLVFITVSSFSLFHFPNLPPSYICLVFLF